MNTAYKETLDALRAMKPVSASPSDVDSAKDLCELLREEMTTNLESADLLFQSTSGAAVHLSGPLVALLERAAELIAEGSSVSLVPVEVELTSQQAADLLNLSRQYLVRLLDDGELPCTMVGTHRRLQLKDVLAYKRLRDADRRAKLGELTRLSQELGGYTELTASDVVEKA